MAIKKYVLKNGETKWQLRIYDGGRSSKRLNRLFDKRIDAETFLHEYQTKLRELEKNPFKTSNFDERIFKSEAEYWLNDGEVRFSKSHVVRVKGILKEILPEFGGLSLDKFVPELLAKFQQAQKARGFAHSTINRKTEVITAILNHSAKHRRIPFNPSNGFKKLKSNSPEMAFWTEDEAAGFLEYASQLHPMGSPDRWVYVVYLLALNSALRAGEIWGLMPGDIAPEGKKLVIKRQFNRVSQSLGPTKSKKTRVVPCTPSVLAELQNLIREGRIPPVKTIFQNHKGNPVCHDNFSDRHFAADVKAWGGRQIRFHDLRHTATTLFITKGVDIKTVKEVCGHADVSTTMNYVHLISENIEKLADTFLISGKEA